MPRRDPGPRRALDAHVLASLGAVSPASALILVLLAAANLVRGSPGERLIAGIELALAALAVALGVLCRRGRVPTRAAQPIAASTFVLYLLVALLAARLGTGGQVALTSSVIPIAAASVLLSHRWMSLVVATYVPVAAALAPQVVALQGPMVFLTLLAVGVVMPLVIHATRHRLHVDLARTLREAEDRRAAQRLLFESSPMPKWVVRRPTLRVVDANQAALAAYGYTREEMLRLRLDDLMADGERARLPEASSPREALARHRRADGTVLDALVTTAPLSEDDVIVVAQDVSERLRAERTLRASEQRFEFLTKATRDLVWDWDLASGALWWNAHFEAFSGESASGLYDLTSWTTRIHPQDAERVLGGIHDAIEGGADRWEAEYRFRRRDGEYATMYDRGYILRDEAGKPLRMVGSMQDVTTLRQAEATLRRQERLSSLGTLVAGVAHEINNPLQYMRGNVDLTQMGIRDALADPALPASLRPALEETLREQEHVLRGIEQLARIASGLRQVARAGDPARSAQDPNRLAATVADMARTRAHAQVDLEVEPGARRCVLANGSEITQVLLNLVFNAIDATRGQPDARVRVQTRDVVDRVQIRVVDNGPGIPADAQARLFTPFFTTKPDGTGLGLSVSERIVRDHGGTLSFQSEPGRTVFEILLPAAPVGVAIAK